MMHHLKEQHILCTMTPKLTCYPKPNWNY